MMKKLALILTVLFVCSAAYGVVLYDENIDGVILDNAGSVPWDTIGMAGMTAGSDPSNSITGGTHQIIGHTNTPDNEPGGDGDAWNFSPAGEWSMLLTQTSGIQFIWLYVGHDKSGGQIAPYWNNPPVSWPASGTEAAGDYSIGFWDGSVGTWLWEITVEEPPIAEPAGLGLIGVALLAMRRRRS